MRPVGESGSENPRFPPPAPVGYTFRLLTLDPPAAGGAQTPSLRFGSDRGQRLVLRGHLSRSETSTSES